MYLADYHMHSKYSFDGSEELDTICQTAIRRGLSEIADYRPYGYLYGTALR